MAQIKLSEVLAARQAVYVTDEDFLMIRGVSLADLIGLVRAFTEDVEDLFQEFMRSKVEGKVIDISGAQDFVITALERSPTLIYALMALACDEKPTPELTKSISELRFAVQFEILTTILKLSITSEIELKKLVETVTQSVAWVASLRQEIQARQVSKTGS